MTSILIIDDEPPVRDVLRLMLSENGYRVYEAESGKKGIELFRLHNPDIVLTDVHMPDGSGLEVTKSIKTMWHDADVVIMTGFGSEEVVIEALRSGASNYIKKPIEVKELLNILESIIFKRENRKRFEVLKEIIVAETKQLVVGNDMSRVWGAINQIFFNISSSIEENLIEGIKLGLYEILINAIEHGNLGITYEEKEDALNSNSYETLVASRLKTADGEGKKIDIRSSYENDTISIEVRDEGKGFDFRKVTASLESEAIFSAHGRGILLASLYYDSVEYIEPGNRVILKKKVKTQQNTLRNTQEGKKILS